MHLLHPPTNSYAPTPEEDPEDGALLPESMEKDDRVRMLFGYVIREAVYDAAYGIAVNDISPDTLKPCFTEPCPNAAALQRRIYAQEAAAFLTGPDGERLCTMIGINVDALPRRIREVAETLKPDVLEREYYPGQKKGHLLILRKDPERAIWTVRCDCGTEKTLRACHLRTHTSCGCKCNSTKNRTDRMAA